MQTYLITIKSIAIPKTFVAIFLPNVAKSVVHDIRKNAHTVYMCGRFHLGFKNKDVQKIVRDIPDEQQIQLRFGDIYPTSFAPVLTAEETFAARWGFERFDKKGVLINARAETVTQKQTFRKSFLERRCLIPASGFYEWDKEKNKYYFSRKDDNFAVSTASKTANRAL